MSRRAVLIVLAVFAVTRVYMVVGARSPDIQNASFGDLEKYQQWGSALRGEGGIPYVDVPVEYPPGVLPFIALAEVIEFAGDDYGHRFIWVMLVVDIAGLMALLLLARRTRRLWGVWIWIAGVVGVGPLLYLRLDLIPAVATLWAIERAAAARWEESGGWLTFGAIAKLYPALLLPIQLRAAARPRRLLVGVTIVAAIYLIPFLLQGAGPGLYENVIAYHSDRGIQVESTWGFLMLAASKLGASMSVNYQFGSIEIVANAVPLFRTISTLLSIAVLVAGSWFVIRRVGREDVSGMTAGWFGLLALLMFVGKVLSPQFVVWLVALAAAGLAWPNAPRLKWAYLSVLPLAALTQAVYPHTIGDVIDPFFHGSSHAGSTLGLVVLGLRNFGLLGAGVVALSALKRPVSTT